MLHALINPKGLRLTLRGAPGAASSALIVAALIEDEGEDEEGEGEGEEEEEEGGRQSSTGCNEARYVRRVDLRRRRHDR